MPDSTWYVTFLGGNDIVWRTESPCHLLNGNLSVLTALDHEDFYRTVMIPNDTGNGFTWGFDLVYDDGSTERVLDGERWEQLTQQRVKLRSLTSVYPEHTGVAVWARPDLSRATHAKALREQHGCRTVAEVDDNYLSSPSFNVFMRAAGMEWKDQLDHMKALASMDAVIFSTRWLRDEYHKAFKKQFGRLRTELHVCGNHIDPRYKVDPIPPRTDGKLRVGFMGSSSHVWDLKLAYGALKWAADQGHEVVIVGHDPEWRDRMPYTHVAWQKPDAYRRVALPLDIGLAPLLSNKHTLGKSDIKSLEYLMSGAVPVLQNNEVYNRTFKHNETAMLAGSPDEFGACVQMLVQDAGLRARIVEQGNQYIREERMIHQHEHEWRQAVFG